MRLDKKARLIQLTMWVKHTFALFWRQGDNAGVKNGPVLLTTFVSEEAGHKEHVVPGSNVPFPRERKCQKNQTLELQLNSIPLRETKLGRQSGHIHADVSPNPHGQFQRG